jgi:hypothetical protein
LLFGRKLYTTRERTADCKRPDHQRDDGALHGAPTFRRQSGRSLALGADTSCAPCT